jgi:XTP/dITP diphosphohydrolase
MVLLFATGNTNKVVEINKLLPAHFTIQSLKDLGFKGVLSEPFLTLEENAKTKAEQLQKIYNKNIFAEDSGLFIDALDGAPGVHSARYAGADATDHANIEKALSALKNEQNRKAYFKTVIHLILNNEHHCFTGECHGSINTEQAGSAGFGYDPIFIPEGYDLSFAQLGLETKNKISHRSKATKLFIDFLLAQ